MATYNNIHRQQLFHWIGSHIDAGLSKLGRLDDKSREAYVACLHGALKCGLWVKTPRDPDFLGNGDLIKVTRPIACFTEWTLGQSLPHTTRYGRLGLGFPKRFVLARGGQPLIYIRDSAKNDPYTVALKTLARYFKNIQAGRKLSARKIDELREHFDYLSHFNKRIRKQLQPRISFKKIKPPRSPTLKTPAAKPNLFVRRFGTTLHYLEEREWRIVYSAALDEFFLKCGKSSGPDYYLPFIPGKELFTVVLPDNRTVNMALSDTFIRKKLYPADDPHVTVLSLQDIGTF
ncbi:MAG: hypothetical protein ACXWIU_09275 [Limisphaerales bacterium]